VTHKPEDEFDVPFGDLPTFGRIRLTQNQIVVVNAEARFAREGGALPEADAKKIWKKLGSENFPYFEPTEQNLVNLVLTQDGATNQSKEVIKGWVLSNAEKTVSVILMPSFINIQVLKYVGFTQSLANLFNQTVEAFVAVTKVSIMQRIGLRYVNKLSDREATTPAFWGPNIKAGFSGPLDDCLGNFITGAHQEVQLKITESASAIVHSGVFLDTASGGTYSFLADIDAFSDHSRDYSKEACENITRKLNRTAYAIFDQMLTPSYIQQMGIEDQESEASE